MPYEEDKTDRVGRRCPECAAQLVYRYSRKHKKPFIGCEGWYTTGCKYTEEVSNNKGEQQNDNVSGLRTGKGSVLPQHTDGSGELL